ncbi:translocation protein SEC62 [Pancytospora philotis]|nr:translocation protein SEC62 [Pancytospora philotis]
MTMSDEQLKLLERTLRALPTTEKIFRSLRRVQTISAIDCVKALSKQGYSADEVKEGIAALLKSYKLVKVRAVGNGAAGIVDFQAGNAVQVTDTYMWVKDRVSHANILIAVLLVLLTLLFVMFQMWPRWLKNLASYVKYPLGGFIIFLFVAAVVRAVVFAITCFTHPPGLWLLPNLFAECGFFESFVPAYAWGSSEASADKNK